MDLKGPEAPLANMGPRGHQDHQGPQDQALPWTWRTWKVLEDWMGSGCPDPKAHRDLEAFLAPQGPRGPTVSPVWERRESVVIQEEMATQVYQEYLD